MKAIFYILSLVVTGAAAFFSTQVLSKFKEEQEVRNATNDRNRIVSREGDAKLEELNAEKEALTSAKEEKATLEASLEKLQADERQLVREIAELDGQLEEQKEKLAQLDQVKKQIEDALGDLGGGITIENIPEKVADIEAERDAKKKELADLETNLEGAEKVVSDNRGTIASLSTRESNRNQRFRSNAMQSVVTAVDNDWGFVVIGAGSNTGFTPQTKLLIQRGGRLVAEVKPSSIEPSQTIADIDEDTLAPGARIQPGDVVILADPASN